MKPFLLVFLFSTLALVWNDNAIICSLQGAVKGVNLWI